ncbi:MAG: alanine--glyoxylate aminotransferase family protein [Halobacteriales archaeon]
MPGEDEEFLLLTPGPVPLAPEVREAMAEPMVSHRSAEFEAVYERARDGLNKVFERSTLDGTRTSQSGTTLLLNGTATLAMEAAISNVVDQDEEVVALVNGKFGRRLARLGEHYARCERIQVDWGESFDLDAVRAAVSDDTAAVTMVHNETSTGLLNPVEAVGDVAADHGANFIVDGVTSIGGDAFRIDDWGVDAAIVGSQKALAAPPGLSGLYLAGEVADRVSGDAGPFYAELPAHRRKAAERQTPYTSAVPLFRGLAVALERLHEEGLPRRIERHRRYAAAFREGFRALGLELFATPNGPSAYSNTVTAVRLPSSIREAPAAFFDAVSDRNVAIAGGQAHLDGELFRVSNMGAIGPPAIERGVRAVGEALAETGLEVRVEDGVAAARKQLAD